MKIARDMDISCRRVKQIWKYLKDHGCEPIIGKETAFGLLGNQYRSSRRPWEGKRASSQRWTPTTGSPSCQWQTAQEPITAALAGLNTGKIKIRGVMAHKNDTPEYVNKMRQEVFQVLAEARSLEELQRIEPKARHVYMRYLDELGDANVSELAIHRRVSRLNYSERCGEASAVQAYIKQSLPLAPRKSISWVLVTK
jgi:hypothetical protein